MLIDTKSLLAKLMATENIVVEQRKVPTATFNVKDRILTIPILAQDITPEKYDLFIGHEVSHALFTPLDGMIKAINRKINSGILNVVEDSRIERKIKNKYPGLRNSFIKAYSELFDENFFGTRDKNLNKLNLIDRINLHCKVGVRLGIKFNDKERELLDAVESTETYDEVIEVAQRIVDFMKQQQKENKNQKKESKNPPTDSLDEKTPQPQDTEKSEEQNEEEESDSEDSTPDQSSEQMEGETEIENEKEDSENTDDSDYDEESTEETLDSDDTESNPDNSDDSDEMSDNNESDPFDDSDEEEITSTTAEAEMENQQKYNSTDNKEYVYTNVPKVDISKAMMTYKEIYEEYRKLEKIYPHTYSFDERYFVQIRKETNKVVSYLVKEFELRKNADQLKRTTISKTGELNLNKIFSYKFSEDIFKKISVVPGGKSHGLVMFLDWSGSMGDHLLNTVKQLISLVMFCKKVNIPYEVYAFAESTHKHHYTPAPKNGDMKTNSYSLLNLLSSKMTAKEFNYAGSILLNMGRSPRSAPSFMRLSSTPLNEAVISAMEIVPAFRKQNRLQMVNTIFLTDGEGSPITGMWNHDPINQRFSTSYLQPSGYNEIKPYVVIRDPVTRREEVIKHFSEQTNALVKLLKARTHSNVIGFYIIGGRQFYKKIYTFFPKATIYDETKIRESFRKNKFAVVTEAAFDEYYVLRSEGLDTDDDEEFQVKENASTKTLVNAFSKYAGGRVSNRVILNRFIGLIT